MSKYSITNMTARDLLMHLQNGAMLETRWTYGKRLNRLKLPTGENLYIQHSNISALIKTGALRSIAMSGDNYLYRLVETFNV